MIFFIIRLLSVKCDIYIKLSYTTQISRLFDAFNDIQHCLGRQMSELR